MASEVYKWSSLQAINPLKSEPDWAIELPYVPYEQLWMQYQLWESISSL